MAALCVEIHLAVVGDTGVGKSCLVERFTENYYVEPCKRVSTKLCTVQMEGKTFVLNICVWRNGGKLPADGYLVVFDVTSQSSLLNIPSLFQEIEAYSKSCVKILVGNKSDCHPLANIASARLFAEEDKVAYFSVSAKDGSLVQEAFLTLISEVMKARKPEYQLSPKGGKTTVPVQTKPITDWASIHHPPHTVKSFEQSTRLFGDIAYAHSVAKTAEKAKRDAEERARKAEQEAYQIQSGEYARQIDEQAIAVKMEAAQWRQRITLLERSVRELTEQCSDLQRSNDDWKKRTLSAEQTISALKQTTSTLENKFIDAERRAEEEQQRAQQQEKRATEAEEQLRSVQNRATTAEQQAREVLDLLEQGQRHWIVSPDEVKLSSGTIGTGGWAQVKRGQFRELNVAVKCLHDIILSPHNRKLFMREMTIAAQVRHPNLVQFLGATTEGHPMIIMELMPTSLRAVLEDPIRAERGLYLSDQQIISIATDVARALNYLHLIKPRAIIHRDISSANVLMEQTTAEAGWRAKLSDYGSANFVHQLKSCSPGSPAYAAPESLNPKKQSSKMDVFSFGILLIEMFTHEFPDPDTRDEMLARIKHPLSETIHKCLLETPSKRPTIQSILQGLHIYLVK